LALNRRIIDVDPKCAGPSESALLEVFHWSAPNDPFGPPECDERIEIEWDLFDLSHTATNGPQPDETEVTSSYGLAKVDGVYCPFGQHKNIAAFDC